MPKAPKSSASSGTRKKHARKAAGSLPEVSPPQKSKSKPSRKELKKGLAPPVKKSYIAPSKLKPAPLDVDPLDSLGLTAVLPADLVVVLRRLAKKDSVTKTRALEELCVWANRAKEEKQEVGIDAESKVSVMLMTSLPVWLHRYPALSVHPSRRIRHLSASLHVSLLSVSILRSAVLTFLLETGSEAQVSNVLGAWCLSAWDVDRGVATLSSTSWREVVNTQSNESESTRGFDDERLVLDDSMLTRSVLPFVVTTVMDPDSTYATLSPSFSTNAGDTAGTDRDISAHVVAPPSSERGNFPSPKLSSGTSRGEDDTESTEDRNARLRVGAMGVLRWIFDTYAPTRRLLDALYWLLSSPQFWSVLHHASHPPFLQGHHQPSDAADTSNTPPAATPVSKGFGSGQTTVRRAGWGIVHALVKHTRNGATGSNWIEDPPDANSKLLSSAILRSAFVEPDTIVRSKMWGPLLLFLTKSENAWILNIDFELVRHKKDGNYSGSESSETEDAMPSSWMDGPASEALAPVRSAAYAEFLAFLSLGCNGSPVQGYPGVLVILSTIPKKILPPTLPALSEFFDAFWAAVDGDAFRTLAVERERGMDAFLGSWGDCLLWTAGKVVKGATVPSKLGSSGEGGRPDVRGSQDGVGQESPASVASALVEMEFGRLVGQLGKGLRVDASVAGGKIAAVLGKLEIVAKDLFKLAWTQVSRFATGAITNSEDPSPGDYALEFLASLHEHLPPEGSSKTEVENLVIEIAKMVVGEFLGQLPLSEEPALYDMNMNGKMLERLMVRFGPVLDGDEEFVKNIDELLQANLASLFYQPSLILSYLTYRSDLTRTVTTWRLLLSTLGSFTDVDLNIRLRVLGVLLDSSQLNGSASYAIPQGGELNRLAEDVLGKALRGDNAMLDLTERLLRKSDAFLDIVATGNIVSTIITTARTHAEHLTRDPAAPLTVLHHSLHLLRIIEREATTLRFSKTIPEVMPTIFLLAFVLPQCSPCEEEVFVLELSKQIWETWRQRADKEARETVFEKVKGSLKGLVMNVNVRPRPTALLHTLQHIDTHTEYAILSEILPSKSELDVLLSSTSAAPIDGTLAIIEPLMPPSSSAHALKGSSNHGFDGSGFSPYARGVGCVLHVMLSDRQFARENMWALRHALTLALFANEILQAPGTNSPIFRSKTADTELSAISRQTQQIAAFLLISPGEETWHKDIVNTLAGKTLQSERFSPIGSFVRLIFEACLTQGTVRDSLVLYTTLRYVLRSATKEDANLWIDLARSLGDKALQTSLAISLAVTEFAPDPPKLDRYRNELASRLTDTSSAIANTTGLLLLRRLIAVAPNPESDVIFLPQQRAVFLVQTLQTWMASDDDLNEDVESEITLLLFHLVPILQNVQGSHWEFIMDMLESNIENSSFKDADTLVLLSRSLRLFTCIQDLSVSNKYLRQLSVERSKNVLALVRNLLAVKTDTALPSKPREACLEQALSVVQDLPDALMDETTLSAMCHLLTEPSVDVQKMTHQFLQRAAIKRTEYLNVEAGVDPDAVIQLPAELLALLQNNIDLESDSMGNEAGGQYPLAYLLSWMILFDLFSDGSLKIKTAYVDQMRDLDIIGGYFLPNIFEILGLGGGRKPFKLDAWTIDEYWTSHYDVDAPQSLSLLAAHLYYRALLTVPSMIRQWWDELKDRQLSAAVTSFTSSHFSPVLIASELALVKASAGSRVIGEESLTDESFNVKVALAVHEVTATFNVDDQQVEIGVKLPVEYPLRAVEVRDIRRVGVPEKLWRKWLFVVQQVITSQNGHIVDALVLFKKNVGLHFEGQVECAICYSIISVVDRSLPAKPCKTCKNRFHSSCLYKWFNTSHSSSCPLCRSDIM